MKLLAIFLLLVPVILSAETVKINESKAVEFKAETNVLKTIHGVGAQLSGEVEMQDGKATGKFKVDLKKFQTGDEARDEHLMATFEVDKYPFAYLEVKDLAFKEGKFPFKGILDLHGVKKEISGNAEMKKRKVKAKFKVSQKDFNLKIPDPKTFGAKVGAAIGAKVDDEINITVNFSI